MSEILQISPKSVLNDIWQNRQETFNGFIDKKLIVKFKNHIRFIDPDHILYIKASSNYSLIYDTEGNSVLSSKTLKHFEERLQDKGFLRVHSGTLINMSKVKGLKRNGMYMIILENDIKILVSRSYKEALFSNIF